MQVPPDCPDWLEVSTAAERPEVWERARGPGVFEDLWPEYNHHGNNTARYFGALVPQHAHLQVLFVDRRSDRRVGRGRTIPFRWAGTLRDLPAGIDALGLRAVDDPDEPTALSALAAEVERDYQGGVLSRLLILAMATVARGCGLSPLLAPVRPSWKDRYPLTSIKRYASWQRADGLPFDPWMRVHVRLGARIVRAERRSLQISAPLPDWEAWTSMAFPDDGRYIFPHGLAPLRIKGSLGEYWEPNVSMLHELGARHGLRT
jgi:hypothetical protein